MDNNNRQPPHLLYNGMLHTCAEWALIWSCSMALSASRVRSLPGGAGMGLLSATAGLRRLTSFFSTFFSCLVASERSAFSPSSTLCRSKACSSTYPDVTYMQKLLAQIQCRAGDKHCQARQGPAPQTSLMQCTLNSKQATQVAHFG